MGNRRHDPLILLAEILAAAEAENWPIIPIFERDASVGDIVIILCFFGSNALWAVVVGLVVC